MKNKALPKKLQDFTINVVEVSDKSFKIRTKQKRKKWGGWINLWRGDTVHLSTELSTFVLSMPAPQRPVYKRKRKFSRKVRFKRFLKKFYKNVLLYG